MKANTHTLALKYKCWQPTIATTNTNAPNISVFSDVNSVCVKQIVLFFLRPQSNPRYCHIRGERIFHARCRRNSVCVFDVTEYEFWLKISIRHDTIDHSVQCVYAQYQFSASDKLNWSNKVIWQHWTLSMTNRTWIYKFSWQQSNSDGQSTKFFCSIIEKRSNYESRIYVIQYSIYAIITITITVSNWYPIWMVWTWKDKICCNTFENVETQHKTTTTKNVENGKFEGEKSENFLNFSKVNWLEKDRETQYSSLL